MITRKLASIQRCVRRAREELASDPEGFEENCSAHDAAVLNVARGCGQAEDLAVRVTQLFGMVAPATSIQVFDLLGDEAVIAPALVRRVKRLVAYSDQALEACEVPDVGTTRAVIETGLDDLVAFGDCVRAYVEAHPPPPRTADA